MTLVNDLTDLGQNGMVPKGHTHILTMARWQEHDDMHSRWITADDGAPSTNDDGEPSTNDDGEPSTNDDAKFWVKSWWTVKCRCRHTHMKTVRRIRMRFLATYVWFSSQLVFLLSKCMAFLCWVTWWLMGYWVTNLNKSNSTRSAISIENLPGTFC